MFIVRHLLADDIECFYFGPINAGVNGIARKVRTTLWYWNDRCFWCGQEMLLGNPNMLKSPNARNKVATIDHIYHRGHPCRTEATKHYVVLSCFKCNADRNAIFLDVFRIPDVLLT